MAKIFEFERYIGTDKLFKTEVTNIDENSSGDTHNNHHDKLIIDPSELEGKDDLVNVSVDNKPNWEGSAIGVDFANSIHNNTDVFKYSYGGAVKFEIDKDGTLFTHKIQNAIGVSPNIVFSLGTLHGIMELQQARALTGIPIEIINENETSNHDKNLLTIKAASNQVSSTDFLRCLDSSNNIKAKISMDGHFIPATHPTKTNHRSTLGNSGHPHHGLFTLFHAAVIETNLDGDTDEHNNKLLKWTGNARIWKDDGTFSENWSDYTDVNAISGVHLSNGENDPQIAGIMVNYHTTASTEYRLDTGHLQNYYTKANTHNLATFVAKGDTRVWCLSSFEATPTPSDANIQVIALKFFSPDNTQHSLNDGDTLSGTFIDKDDSSTWAVSGGSNSTYNSSGINGKPTISFGDTAIHQQNTNNCDLNGADFFVSFFFRTPNSWTGSHPTLFRISGGSINLKIRASDGVLFNWSHFNTGFTPSLNTNYIISYVVDRSNNIEKLRVIDSSGNITEYTNNNNSIRADSATPTIILGANNTSPSDPSHIELGQLIIGTYTAQNLTDVESRLKGDYFNIGAYSYDDSVINIGEYITSSEINGYAHKQQVSNQKYNYTVGRALRGFDWSNFASESQLTTKTVSDSGKTYKCVLLPISCCID